MKRLIIVLLSLSGFGCASQPAVVESCPGDTKLPAHYASDFQPVEDQALLNSAIGEPGKGGLCKGQVYQSTEQSNIIFFRAWNSTNPGSKKGDWWAFSQPAGKVAQYREDYEICYQWSPLDMMVSCQLKPGSKVVVGPGQSAHCSQYLNYPSSAKQQIYVQDASTNMVQCRSYEGEFSWREIKK